jgi:hypothetical protein
VRHIPWNILDKLLGSLEVSVSLTVTYKSLDDIKPQYAYQHGAKPVPNANTGENSRSFAITGLYFIAFLMHSFTVV